MSESKNKYNLLINYLKGMLSNRERYDLEKEMMQDAFDEEAFEGLSRLSAGDLESDMNKLMDRIDERIKPVKKRNLTLLFRIAATMVLLIGMGSILYITLKPIARNPVIAESKRIEKQSPAENPSPAAPLTKVQRSEDVKVSKKEIPVLAENRSESVPPEEQIRDRSFAPAPMVATPVARKASVQNTQSGKETTKPITAKVVDSDGQPLPGVTVLAKGTNHGTITDSDGNFSLPAGDSESVLILSYVGFTPLELDGNTIAGKEITMTEDLVALEEVVVVGYGTRVNKNSLRETTNNRGEDISNAEPGVDQALQGKAAGVQINSNSPDAFDELNLNTDLESYNLIRPVPPGGSLKAFKKWVDYRIDHSKFRSFTGKNRVQVYLTVHVNGSISDIRIGENTPGPIAAEYKRVIAQSPSWQPAIENSVPVEAEIMIRFIVQVK